MRRYLTPRMLGAHLATVVVLLAALGLGAWQYGVWHHKRYTHSVDLTHRDPKPLADVMGANEAFPGDALGQPVIVSGTWLTSATVYVSGREHDGRRGYWVVTPLSNGSSTAAAVPVVRGWTADPDTAPAPPSGPGTLVGWLQPSEDDGSVDPGADDRTDAAGGVIVPVLQVADLVQRVHQDLYSGYVVDADRSLTGPWAGGTTAVNDGTQGLEAVGLEALPQPGPFTALQNLSYAVEWWFLGGFAIFVWARYLRDRRREWEQEALEALRRPVSTVEA